MSKAAPWPLDQYARVDLLEPSRGELGPQSLFTFRLGVKEPETPIQQNSLSPVGGMDALFFPIRMESRQKSIVERMPSAAAAVVLPFLIATPLEEAWNIADYLLAEDTRAFPASNVFGSGKHEIITPAAEHHARKIGLYGSLILAKETVREVLPCVRALTIDLVTDPEAEDGDPVVCFSLAVGESVDRMLELDDVLQRTLYDRLPARDRANFSFVYDFE